MDLKPFDLVRTRLNPGDELELYYVIRHREKTLFYAVSLNRPELAALIISSDESELVGNLLNTATLVRALYAIAGQLDSHSGGTDLGKIAQEVEAVESIVGRHISDASDSDSAE